MTTPVLHIEDAIPFGYGLGAAGGGKINADAFQAPIISPSVLAATTEALQHYGIDLTVVHNGPSVH